MLPASARNNRRRRGRPSLPRPDDFFVLKPKHSGFHAPPLEVLLEFLDIKTLILTGFAADICVLDTANDASMREYQWIVPSDCVASESAEITRATLDHLRDRLKARVEASEDLLAVR